jgi:hypothetical protein
MNRTARARRNAERTRKAPNREKAVPASKERVFAHPGRLGALKVGSMRGRGRAAPGGKNRVFAHPERFRTARLGPPQFDPVASPATLAGSTPHFNVYYASVLGPAGDKVAQAVLKNCERDYKSLSGFFGQQQELAFNIVVAPLSQQMDGTGGAYHHTCLATDLYCDVPLIPNMDTEVTNAREIRGDDGVIEAV